MVQTEDPVDLVSHCPGPAAAALGEPCQRMLWPDLDQTRLLAGSYCHARSSTTALLDHSRGLRGTESGAPQTHAGSLTECSGEWAEDTSVSLVAVLEIGFPAHYNSEGYNSSPLLWHVSCGRCYFNPLETNSSTLHTLQHLHFQVRKVLSCLHTQGASGLGGVPGYDHPGESLSPVAMPCDVLNHGSPPVEMLVSLFHQGDQSL